MATEKTSIVESFGEKLLHLQRNERARAYAGCGETEEDLAKCIGIARATYRDWKNNKLKKHRHDKLQKIEKAFKLPTPFEAFRQGNIEDFKRELITHYVGLDRDAQAPSNFAALKGAFTKRLLTARLEEAAGRAVDGTIVLGRHFIEFSSPAESDERRRGDAGGERRLAIKDRRESPKLDRNDFKFVDFAVFHLQVNNTSPPFSLSVDIELGLTDDGLFAPASFLSAEFRGNSRTVPGGNRLQRPGTLTVTPDSEAQRVDLIVSPSGAGEQHADWNITIDKPMSRVITLERMLEITAAEPSDEIVVSLRVLTALIQWNKRRCYVTESPGYQLE